MLVQSHRAGTASAASDRVWMRMLVPASSLLLALGLVLFHDVAQVASAEELTLHGPGLDPEDGIIAAIPLADAKERALAEYLAALRRELGRSARALETVAEWLDAVQATPYDAVFLGRRDPATVPLALGDSQAGDLLQRATSAGLDLRVHGDTLVIAEANLAYVVASDEDWPLLAALAAGTLEGYEEVLLAHPDHPRIELIRERFDRRVEQRLRAAVDVDTFTREFALWRAEGLLVRTAWMEFRDAFVEQDIKDMWDATEVEGSPVAPFAELVVGRLLTLDGASAAPHLERDPDLATDIAWWERNASEFAALSRQAPLPPSYWRLAGYGDEQAAARLAEQVRQYGTDVALQRTFTELDPAHLAALLAYAPWQNEHAAALTWLGERLGEREAELSQIERDALATALERHVRAGGELSAATMRDVVAPLGLVETLPALIEVAQQSTDAVQALRAIAWVAPELAGEAGWAGQWLQAVRFDETRDEQLLALCGLARRSVDTTAAQRLMALAQHRRASDEVRAAAAVALYVVSPADAMSVLRDWQAESPGEWAVQAHQWLYPPAPELVDPSSDAPIAEDDVTMILHGTEHLGPLVTRWLIEELKRQGAVVIAGGEQTEATRHIYCEPNAQTGDATTTVRRSSNLGEVWQRGVELRVEGGGAGPTVLSLEPLGGEFLARASGLEWQFEAWSAELDDLVSAAVPEPGVPTDMPDPSPDPGSTRPRIDLDGNGVPHDTPAIPDPPTVYDEYEAPGARLHVHATLGSSRFSESEPQSAELDASFAEGLRLGVDVRLEWNEVLPDRFGLQFMSELDTYVFGDEVWRAQVNDLSRLDIAIGLGAHFDVLAPRHSTDWGVRALLLPTVQFMEIKRTNAFIGDAAQPDDAQSRTYFGGRLGATIWNERPFSNDVPFGLVASGEFGGYTGSGGGYRLIWYAGLTWTPSNSILLLLAVEHRYEELDGDDERSHATDNVGGRLTLTITW